MDSLIGLLEDDILVLSGIKYKLLGGVRKGGSSYVYEAQQVDGADSGKTYMIKELCPASLYKRDAIERVTQGREKGLIWISNSLQGSEIAKYKAIWEGMILRAKKEKKLVDELSFDDKRGVIRSGYLLYRKCVKKNGTVYNIIEWKAGESLAEMISKYRFEGKDFKYICKCIDEILMHLNRIHENHLHLDISPDNIFVFEDDPDYAEIKNVCLIDYNSAIKKGQPLEKWISTVKKGYSAPELYYSDTKPEELDERTDLYSVTAVFFKLLVGRSIQKGDYGMPSRWQHLLSNDDGILKDALKPLIKATIDFILRGIAPAVESRFKSVPEMRKAIEELIEIYESPIRLNKREFKEEIGFVGRTAELAEIDNKLKTQNAVFLCGIGGIGKSALARKYIAMQNDIETIVYVEYSHSLARDMVNSIVGLNTEEYRNELITDEAIFESILFPKLQELVNPRVLLFIDNFDTDFDQYFKKIIEALDCKKIITTRYDYENRKPGHVLKIGPEKEIENLKQLFYNNGPKKYHFERDLKTDNQVERLIKALHGHTQAVKLLANQARTLRLELSLVIERFIKAGYEGGYDTPFYDGLSDEEKKATAYGHIREIFNYSGIDGDKLELIKTLTFIPYSGIDEQKLLEWCGFIGEEGKQELNELKDASWIELDEMSGVVTVHPVISEVLWRELAPKLSDALLEKYTTSFLKNLVSTKQTDTENTLSQEAIVFFAGRVREDTRQAAKVFNAIGSYWFGLGQYGRGLDCSIKELEVQKSILPYEHDGLLKYYEDVIWGFNKYFQFEAYSPSFNKLGRVSYFVEIMDEISALKTYLDTNSFSRFISLCASTITALSSYAVHMMDDELMKTTIDTIIFMTSKLDSAINSMGTYSSSRELLSQCYHSIGLLYSAIKQFDNALEYEEKALETYDKVLFRNTVLMADIFEGMSKNQYMLYHLHKALEFAQEALEVREAIFPENSPVLTGTYSWLSDCHYAMGQFDEARKCLEKVFKQQEITSNDNNLPSENIPKIEIMYSDAINRQLDVSLEHEVIALEMKESELEKKKGELSTKKQGLYEDKIIFAYRCFDDWLNYKRLGQNDKALTSAINAAAYYKILCKETYDMGIYDRALEYGHKSLYVLENDLSENHLDICENHNYLSLCYFMLQQYEKSLESELKAMETRASVLFEDDLSMATHHYNIACIYFCLTEYSKQLVHALKALEIRQSLLPENHADILLSMKNTKDCYLKLGDYDNALKLVLRMLESQGEQIPESNTEVTEIYTELAAIYFALAQYEKAIEYEIMAIKAGEVPTQKNYLNHAKKYSRIGVSYGEINEPDKALEYGVKALEMRLIALPEHHPDLALSYNNVGKAYSDLHEYEQALESLQKALEIISQNTSDCYFAGNIYCNIGITYGSLGEIDLAIDNLKQSEALLIKWNNIAKLSDAYQKLIEIFQSQGQHLDFEEYTQKLNNLKP